jgi:hypothetical protein
MAHPVRAGSEDLANIVRILWSRNVAIEFGFDFVQTHHPINYPQQVRVTRAFRLAPEKCACCVREKGERECHR